MEKLSRIFFISSCLVKSITLHRYLKANGIDSMIKIGVLKDAKQFKAHAWVISGSRVLNDDDKNIKNFNVIYKIK